MCYCVIIYVSHFWSPGFGRVYLHSLLFTKNYLLYTLISLIRLPIFRKRTWLGTRIWFLVRDHGLCVCVYVCVYVCVCVCVWGGRLCRWKNVLCWRAKQLFWRAVYRANTRPNPVKYWPSRGSKYRVSTGRLKYRTISDITVPVCWTRALAWHFTSASWRVLSEHDGCLGPFLD